jgi:hypothetical protein
LEDRAIVPLNMVRYIININVLLIILTEEIIKQYSPPDFLEGLSPETLERLAIILSQLGVNQIKNQEQ